MSSTVVISIKVRDGWEGISTSFLSDAINWLLRNVDKASQFAPSEFKGFDPAKKHWFRRLYEHILSRVTKSVRLPIELANKLKSIPNWQEIVRNIIDSKLNPIFDDRVFDEEAYEELCYQCIDAVKQRKFITANVTAYELEDTLFGMLEQVREDFIEAYLSQGNVAYYDELSAHVDYLINRKNRLLKISGKPTWLSSLYVTVAKTIRTFIQ